MTPTSRASHHIPPCKSGSLDLSFSRVSEGTDTTGRLSERELQMLVLLVDGLGNREIGERLGVSPRTVQGHVSSAMRKTGTRTRTQLAVHSLRAGLVALHPPDERPDAGCER